MPRNINFSPFDVSSSQLSKYSGKICQYVESHNICQPGAMMGNEIFKYREHIVLMLQCKREIDVNAFTLVQTRDCISFN